MTRDAGYRFWNNPKVVREFYQAEAPGYWRDFLGSFKKPFSYSVLDLGCGGGRNTELLIKLGFNTWACDLYDLMLKFARKRIFGLIDPEEVRSRILKASMLDLPFEARCFDIIVANGIYHNTTSKSEFIRAIHESSRVLKENGFLCLNVFYRGFVAPELKVIKSNKDTFITHEGLHLTLLSKSQIRKILSEAGFRPQGEILSYKRKVSTGFRSVLRGVFKKNQ